MSHRSRDRFHHKLAAKAVHHHGFMSYLRSGHMLEWPVALDALVRITGMEHAGPLHIVSLGGIIVAVALFIVARGSTAA